MADNAQTYKGQQIILSSGRLLLNSRSDSVFISSRKYINLSASDKVTIDVGPDDSDNEENMFLVNAPKIQFGLNRNGNPEPITKADELETIINDLMNSISIYADMVQVAALVPGPLMSSMLIPANSYLKGKFSQISINLNNFKSKTSFTI